jgi:hypothetical protein
MGTIKTTNIETITGSGTLTLGQSGETITIPSGVTITNNGTQTGFGGTNTPAFQAYRNAGNQAISASTETLVQFDTELFDTNSCYDNSTYTFTPTTSGKYFIYSAVEFTNTVNAGQLYCGIYKNNSLVAISEVVAYGTRSSSITCLGTTIQIANGTTDYFTIKGFFEAGSMAIRSGASFTYFGAYKIIE